MLPNLLYREHVISIPNYVRPNLPTEAERQIIHAATKYSSQSHHMIELYQKVSRELREGNSIKRSLLSQYFVVGDLFWHMATSHA